MDIFVLQKMKAHLILFTDDVIPDWSAARGFGVKFICWIIQGVKSICIKFANVMASSLSRKDAASFTHWVSCLPHLPSPFPPPDSVV